MSRKIGASIVRIVSIVSISVSSFALLALPILAQTANSYEVYGVNLVGTPPWVDATTNKTITSGQMKTPDGKLMLSIPIGTIFKNAVGQSQPFIAALSVADPPKAASSQTTIFVFELGTPGAVFNPSVSMTMWYGGEALPVGVAEDSLYVAQWNGSSWVKLFGLSDRTADTISVSIADFATYGLFGVTQSAPPATTSVPPTTQPTTSPPTSFIPPPTGTDGSGSQSNLMLPAAFLGGAVLLIIVLWVRTRNK